LHDLYLKAVNHPIRRQILAVINDEKKILKTELLSLLKDKGIIDDEKMFIYNMDFLINADCVKMIHDKNNQIFYGITQKGKVVEHL
jgi:hypothetical protein